MSDVSAMWLIISRTEWLDEKRLLFGLGTLYTILIVSTVVTWKRMNFQAGYFCLLCIAIYAAEHINRFCAENWKLISNKHQYFDSPGLFISVVYSMPILFNLLVLVIAWMKTASSDLIAVKQKELLKKNKEKSKKDK